MNKYVSRYLLYYPSTLLRGEFVHGYLEDYRKLQWMGNSDLEEYQLRCLKKIIRYAYDNIRYYRSIFDREGLKPSDISSLSDIKKIPILSKKDIVDNAKFLRARNKILTFQKTTGGSTGRPVTIRKNPKALARERAATWRAYEWAGVEIGDPQARFWGVPINVERRVFAKVADLISNRRRYSSFGIDDTVMEKYYRDLCKFEPKYIYGYVSAISDFAAFIDKKGYEVPPLSSVITTSEILDTATRQRIQSTFNANVFNEYGCGEVGSIAHECEYHNMHLMSDNLIVEEENISGVASQLIITDLHNLAMPLIRYCIEDLGHISASRCQCRRKFPVLSALHGRTYDTILSPEGRRYHAESLMYIFEEIKEKHGGFAQFQVIQEDRCTLVVRLVTEITQDDLERQIISRVKTEISPNFFIKFLYSREPLKRERSGKMRIIKSNLQV